MSTDFVEKFGYRSYEGTTESRWRRIWSLTSFVLISTWRKSTFGKVLLVIILLINFMVITFGAMAIRELVHDPDLTSAQQDDMLESSLNGMVGQFYALDYFVTASTSHDLRFLSFSMEMGFLIIALFAIAGSGIFADDRQGKVIEIYLSKMQRSEYISGKLISLFLYFNIFSTLPLLAIGFAFIQALGLNHLNYLHYYTGILIYGLFSSLILGALISIFSLVSEKRSFASLSFFLLYLLSSIFGGIVISLSYDTNDFILLLSPTIFLSLLGYICIGDFELGVGSEGALYLNNGSGLEYYHILGITFVLVILIIFFMFYKLKKLTTEDLA